MTSQFLSKFEGRVPRYTSYPTAPHFTPAVGAARYRAWLGELAADASLSLYLHVPFCARLCWYCGCHTTVAHSDAPVAAYSNLLIREIGLVAEALPGRLPVGDIHWGGGTPTVLKPADFLAVTEELRRRFDAAGAHVAVEIDPRNLLPETIEALRAAGVDRASLGVQDFQPEVQQAVNRIQSFETTAHAVENLRAAGVRDINIDLIYGLPHQTAESMVETVDRVVSLRPDRIALFGYAHVPWMKPHQRLLDEAALPKAAKRWRIYWEASRRLMEHRYTAIGLDHFAAPGSPLLAAAKDHRLARNFQGYTAERADAVIGFGASAIGTLPQGYVQNEVPIRSYREAILADRLATARGIAVTPEDRLRRAVIERIMCDCKVDVGAICLSHRFPESALDAEIGRLDAFVQEGMVEIAGRTVTVTEDGRALLRSIASVFDAYLTETAEPRHSAAV